MKIRQAKKIILGNHWYRYCQKMRPMFFSQERYEQGSLGWVQPSFHDIPNPTFQKARRKFFGAAKKFAHRHGYNFDDKTKGNG